MTEKKDKSVFCDYYALNCVCSRVVGQSPCPQSDCTWSEGLEGDNRDWVVKLESWSDRAGVLREEEETLELTLPSCKHRGKAICKPGRQASPETNPGIFSWLCHLACGISVPWPGIETEPWEWKPRILTIRRPGNFWSWTSVLHNCEKVFCPLSQSVLFCMAAQGI